MAIVIIGGHARNVGKTSVAAAVIAAWPERRWTAVKISSHWHDRDKGGAECSVKDVCRIDEELQSGRTDTGRYLAAGAARSYWVRVLPGRLEECLPELRHVIESGNVVVESNAIVRLVRHDLFLMVYSRAAGEFKQSARETLPLADAIVSIDCDDAVQVREGLPSGAAPDLPVFPLQDPRKLTPELVRFIKSRLELNNNS
jgi:hypothetical protein